MKLKFIKPHKSIVRLNDIEINDFAIITGLNGTGKTHLLQAIEEGAIMLEGIQSSEIVYYNYSEFNIDYDHASNTRGRPDQQPNVKKNSGKNGSTIVQRITAERNKIISNVDFLRNTEFDNLIENVLNNGHQLSILDLEETEMKRYIEFQQISSESINYLEMLHSLPEKVRVIHDFYEYYIPSIQASIGSIKTKLINYFNKIILRNMGFNPNLLLWTELDEEKYYELHIQNPNFNVWEYEGIFSNNFFNFILIYQDLKIQFTEYLDVNLAHVRNELTMIFKRLEVVLKEKLTPEHIRFIKNFSIDNNVFSNLQIDSGALDLNLIANEEKQYQINKNQNDYNGFLKREKAIEVNYYSNDEFIEIYGNSPIKLLNEALNKYDCNGYEFRSTDVPNQYGFDPQNYELTISLYNKQKGYQTNIESLSSGEKTLLALTFYIYKLKYKRKVVASVLLLDEIDSALHPSMSKRLVTVLYDLFFKELDIKIVLSSHSPSTVAFAPENSLYIMKGEGDDRLYKSSKDVALDELTFGVPSFSINYENRRQIFVESKYDVEYYERLYQIFKKRLNSEISLNFIASGDVQNNKNRQPISTCDQVIKITDLLRNSGNKFIWGIIDWDLNSKKPKSEFVRILGWEERYSIENFLLDPLLMAILLMVEKIRKPEFFGLGEEFRIYEIFKCDETELEKIINKILEELNGELEIDFDNKIEYKTVGGKKLTLPKTFTNYQGHKLEDKYIKVFPELNRLKRNDEKALKISILDKIVEEFPDLAPSGLLDILVEVQKV